MLRRRILLLIASSYRWARSRMRIVMEQRAEGNLADVAEAESARSVVTRRIAKAIYEAGEEAYTAISMQMGRRTAPGIYDPVQGISLRRIINRCKSIAYSAFEAPGTGGVRVVMGRFANAIATVISIGSSLKSMVIGSAVNAEIADSIGADSKKGINTGNRTYSEAVESFSVNSDEKVITGIVAKPVSTPTTLSTDNSGIQNGVYAKGMFWIEPYYEDDMLVIRQAYNITEADGRLEVR